MVFLVAVTYDKNIAINSSTDKTCYSTGKDENCYKSFRTENIRQQWEILSNRIILFAMCVWHMMALDCVCEVFIAGAFYERT